MTALALWDRASLPGSGVSASLAPYADAGMLNAASKSASSGIFPGVKCDPMAIRRKFPDRWAGFLRSHFRDHVEVAYVFSVDEKTARHWWAGTTGPQGWAVAFAHSRFPDALEWKDAA